MTFKEKIEDLKIVAKRKLQIFYDRVAIHKLERWGFLSLLLAIYFGRLYWIST